MSSSRVLPLAALALLCAAGRPLRAQAAPKVELAFGYECGDRFLVKNDGALPVLVEYAPAGSEDRSQLHLAGKQAAEVAMAQDGDLDLFVGGKLVASAAKGNRACAAPHASVAGIAGDSVARGGAAAGDSTAAPQAGAPAGTPVPPDSVAQSDSAKGPTGIFVYAPPTDMVIEPPPPDVLAYRYFPHPSEGPIGNEHVAASRSPATKGGGKRKHK